MNINYLKKLIKNKNITVYELNKITNLNESNLGKILNKKTKNPGIDYALKIAKAFNLDDHEFAELCGYRKE